MTNNLVRRIYEHKNGIVEGYTKMYNINKFVYYESSTDVKSIIVREKQIKGWIRAKKDALVETMNEKWDDLYESILQ